MTCAVKGRFSKAKTPYTGEDRQAVDLRFAT